MEKTIKKQEAVKKITPKKKNLKKEVPFPSLIKENSPYYGVKLDIGHLKTCECKPNHINCISASQWIKNQLGVWEFFYEKRDIRDKSLHPATFPLSLAKRVIEQFSHQGELVLDPFVGRGTTLLATQDLNRNAVGKMENHFAR